MGQGRSWRQSFNEFVIRYLTQPKELLLLADANYDSYIAQDRVLMWPN